MKQAIATDFGSWRRQARALLAQAVPPQEVSWASAANASLFDAEGVPPTGPVSRIPREIARLLEACACHRDPARWALMYRLLWRVTKGERALVADAADPDMARLRAMASAVDREVHKMHAFVRFRETADEKGVLYAAWFEPEHDILRRAAPFFRDRFASMRWVIATPRGAARWDGTALEFLDGPLARPEGIDDAHESLWRTYYASIFNPARLNPQVMRQHMPQRYWKNLPEAGEIARLSRPAAVLAAPVPPPHWSARVQVELTPLGELDACRRCPLWEHATQAVPGEGPERAALMLVGEQPGDEEDLKGQPFVGPAGKVLDRALAAAGIERRRVYLTNAVKHFKWQLRGKRRMHRTPAQREIDACLGHLERELEKVGPRVVVAMGASAAYALTQQRLPIAALRGEPLPHPSGARLLVTYHPSAVLRAGEDGDALFEALCEDLDRAARLAPMSTAGGQGADQ